eukprot:scaffold7033_cov257-Pinguiococcus_pyrenoidosus.AAC.4
MTHRQNSFAATCTVSSPGRSSFVVSHTFDCGAGATPVRTSTVHRAVSLSVSCWSRANRYLSWFGCTPLGSPAAIHPSPSCRMQHPQPSSAVSSAERTIGQVTVSAGLSAARTAAITLQPGGRL